MLCMKILKVKQLIVEDPNSMDYLAEHLAVSGTTAVIDMGSVRALVANARDEKSEISIWNTKRRLNGKFWGTWGDESQVLDLIDISRIPSNLKGLIKKDKLEIFKGSFLRYPAIMEKLPPTLRGPNGTHQTFLPKDYLNTRLQHVIRSRFHEDTTPLLIATSFNISGATPGKTKWHETVRLAADLNIPVVAHRLTKNPFKKSGSFAIFDLTEDGIHIVRRGSGEDDVIRELTNEGYRVFIKS